MSKNRAVGQMNKRELMDEVNRQRKVVMLAESERDLVLRRLAIMKAAFQPQTVFSFKGTYYGVSTSRIERREYRFVSRLKEPHSWP
jgi:hypothetical protein